ncbi:zinc ribbon domain-containing protein [Deltaproteobacteria bacterium TL4]
MPIYEYICNDCNYEFEELQRFNDPHLEQCPRCGVRHVERKVSASAFHLKGGGWYKDGYSSAPTSASESTSASSEGAKSSSKTGGESKKSDTSSKDSKSSSENSSKVPAPSTSSAA